MPIASRTPEGGAFSCKVCGAVDRVEPSPLTGDAVCPRCGGYLRSVLAGFDGLFDGPEPVCLDTELESIPLYDRFDLAGRAEELGHKLGVRVDWNEFDRCRTVEDMVRFLASLHNRE